jgi:hypothetical protein
LTWLSPTLASTSFAPRRVKQLLSWHFETIDQEVAASRLASNVRDVEELLIHNEIRNGDFKCYSGRAEEFSSKDYWVAAEKKFGDTK